MLLLLNGVVGSQRSRERLVAARPQLDMLLGHGLGWLGPAVLCFLLLRLAPRQLGFLGGKLLQDLFALLHVAERIGSKVKAKKKKKKKKKKKQ